MCTKILDIDNEIINIEDLYNHDNFQKLCDINFDIYKILNKRLYNLDDQQFQQMLGRTKKKEKII